MLLRLRATLHTFPLFYYARAFYARTHVTTYAIVEIRPYNIPETFGLQPRDKTAMLIDTTFFSRNCITVKPGEAFLSLTN